MGIYINPTNQSKEEWLIKHATERSRKDYVDRYDSIIENKCVPVCLVDNVIFSAAAVAFSKEEAKAFAWPDNRQKMWFVVPFSALSDDSGISDKILQSYGYI